MFRLQVYLADEKADICYNADRTTPELLREAIDDMGFEAYLPGRLLQSVCVSCELIEG